MNWIQILGAVEIGLIYGLIAMGVYFTFRISDFPDLTVDGSFPLGAATAAVLITGGMSPWLATGIAILAGMLAGFCTGFLNVRWKILNLLAGILTMTALYSINLRIMGQPNIALFNSQTVFSVFPIHPIFVITFILGLLTWLLARFLASDLGLGLRAVGLNPQVGGAYGINVGHMKLMGLSLSNALVALAGALFAQLQGFADIAMGSGTIINGLAAIIIGEALFKTRRLFIILAACVFGAILYRVTITFALNSQVLGLKASDLNLVTTVLVVCIMIVSYLKHKKIKG